MADALLLVLGGVISAVAGIAGTRINRWLDRRPKLEVEITHEPAVDDPRADVYVTLMTIHNTGSAPITVTKVGELVDGEERGWYWDTGAKDKLPATIEPGRFEQVHSLDEHGPNDLFYLYLTDDKRREYQPESA